MREAGGERAGRRRGWRGWGLRVVGWGSVSVLLLAVLLQQPSVHQFLFHSDVVEADEDVLLYPTISRYVRGASPASGGLTSAAQRHLGGCRSDGAETGSDEGTCCVRLHIHGCIYEEEKGDYFNAVLMQLASYLAGRYDYADALSNPLFRHRLGRFLVDNEGSKRVTIHIPLTNGSVAAIPLSHLSAGNGHFEDSLLLPLACSSTSEAQGHNQGFPVIEDRNGSRRISFYATSVDNRTFHGHSLIVEDTGISFISDIDDTIKVTGVLNGSILFENTMLREFYAVKGMSKLYNFWKDKYSKQGHDVQFHYVSGGPWQFYPVLQEFLHSAGADFPEGTWHLNQIFRDFSSFMTFIRSPLEFKIGVIKPLITSFPRRKFVLVGDDGQQDPEVYAQVAEAFPDQIVHIFIHHVNGTNAEDRVTSFSVAEQGLDRCRKAFARIPEDKWTLFSDAELDRLDEKEFTL